MNNDVNKEFDRIIDELVKVGKLEAIEQYKDFLEKSYLIDHVYWKVGSRLLKDKNRQKEATAWFLEGIKLFKDADCYYFLGKCQEYGHGMEKNLSAAIDSYKASFEINHYYLTAKRIAACYEKINGSCTEALDWYLITILNLGNKKKIKSEIYKRVVEQFILYGITSGETYGWYCREYMSEVQDEDDWDSDEDEDEEEVLY